MRGQGNCGSIFCKVFHHLMRRVIPSSEKNCVVGSKETVVCGSKLENLRKEKKATKYNDLKVVECCSVSQVCTILSNCSNVITVF